MTNYGNSTEDIFDMDTGSNKKQLFAGCKWFSSFKIAPLIFLLFCLSQSDRTPRPMFFFSLWFIAYNACYVM